MSAQTYQTQYVPPTAWQSAPVAVRFAVWVWAVAVIAGVAGAIVGLVTWAIVLLATLGSM